MTRFFPVMMDQPEEPVKVAPPGITRGVSAVTRSVPGLASAACGDAALGAKVVDARKASRAVRRTDM